MGCRPGGLQITCFKFQLKALAGGLPVGLRIHPQQSARPGLPDAEQAEHDRATYYRSPLLANTSDDLSWMDEAMEASLDLNLDISASADQEELGSTSGLKVRP